MFGIHDLGVFLGSCLLLCVTPGPDTFYILGRTLAQGMKAGLASTAGIGCGLAVHTLLGAFGLSALLAASPTAFHMVKYLGAGYLIYLGICQWRTSSTAPEATAPPSQRLSWSKLFLQGVITNVLNPKVMLFFLAFIPQFIHHDSQQKVFAFIFLGVCFILTGLLWCLLVVTTASKLALLLQRKSPTTHWLQRGSGVLFILLGLRLALASLRPPAT